ncbi:MAG: hypothetical protein AMJ65_05450 [Phycisphaerae bacterium SG8_4]|nr:MAG: hypothetical protein AMJ65_05450 [Phycisphaerae bacterium SG8_4]
MRSIGIALTWEFWRRSWWWILSAVMLVACITITTSYYGSASQPKAETMAKIHYRAVFHLFLCVAFFSLWSQLDKKNNRLGFPGHLYTRPTRTWVFVGWQMLFGAVTVTLLYLVEVGCVRILWSITWPLAGPILLSITVVACAQAVFWSTVAHPVLRALICLSVVAALQMWQFSRYGAMTDYPNTSGLTHMWNGLTLGEFLTLAPCLVAAYVIAVVGVSRDRCGDCAGWPRVRAFFDSAINLLPGRAKPFDSPAAAQFWREWHEKDRLMPVACGVWVAAIVLLGVSGITDTMHTILLFIFTSQIGLAVPFLAGLLVGQSGRKSKIGDFKATLPVTNSRLSAIILRAGAAGLLSAWVIYVAGLLFMIGWYFMVGKGVALPLAQYYAAKDAILELGFGKTLLLVVAGIAAVWGSMGLGATMTLIGRPWLLFGFWLALCFILPVFVALEMLHTFNLIPPGIFPAVVKSVPWIIGACCLLGTAWAFIAAHRRHLIGWAKLCLGPGLWLLLCLAVGWVWLPRDEPGLPTIVLVMGLLALAVAPLATAPLALAWNRHR